MHTEERIRRPGILEILLTVLQIMVLSAIPFVAIADSHIPLAASTVMVLVAAYQCHVIATQVGLIAVGSFAWKYVWPGTLPFFLAAPLVFYFLCIHTLPAFKPFRHSLHLGNIQRPALILMLVTVSVSFVALVVWYLIANPDLHVWQETIPKVGSVQLVFIGIGFAVLNAAIEEMLFRGVLLQCLEAVLGRTLLPILVQAIAFGLIHFEGVPGGWFGVGLAAIYGFFLGHVKRRSGGMLAPLLTHVVADLVIFALLLQGVTRNGS